MMSKNNKIEKIDSEVIVKISIDKDILFQNVKIYNYLNYKVKSIWGEYIMNLKNI